MSNLRQNNSIISDTLDASTSNKYEYFDDYSPADVVEYLLYHDYSQAFEAWQNGNTIYRGDISLKGNNIIGVTPGTRVSQNTSNIYTSLLSLTLQSWKEYPPRNHCVICTNRMSYASEYVDYNNDSLFIVFPKNGTKIGISSEYDIWFSFKSLYKKYGLFDISEFDSDMLKYISIVFETDENNIAKLFATDSASQINDVFKKLETKTNQIIDTNYKECTGYEVWQFHSDCLKKYRFNSKAFLRDLIDHSYNYSVMTWLDDILSPKTNGFKLGNIFDICDGNSHEVWFNNQCLMISVPFFKKIMEALTNA